jgi:hypothetical protein
MAYTVTVLKKSVHGDERVHHLKVVADGAESNVNTGLDVVYNFSAGYASMTAITSHMYMNVDSSGTAKNGYIGTSGLTSGDTYYLTVYGR